MFKPFYQVLEEQASTLEKAAPKFSITLTASDMPLIEFLRYIADKSQISIVCDEALDGRIVNINVRDTDVADVLSAVARRYNVDITEQGGVYYIGTLQAQDRALLVRKVKRLSAKEITDMVGTINSEVGRVSASSDGLTVVGDRVRVLQNINSMFNQIESAQTNTWVLQMYLISGTTSASREVGIDTTATFELAATFASTTSKAKTLGAFNAVLRAARSNSKYEIIAEPMMLITDGGKSSIQDGETIPIPRKTVSDSGTVTTTGYEYVKTGIVVNTALREMSLSAATCNIEIDLTQVTSYIDSAPVTSGQNFKTTAVLESGGTYLVGSLSRRSARQEKKGVVINTFSDNNDTGGNIEVWLRCYRIQGSFQSNTSTASVSASP